MGISPLKLCLFILLCLPLHANSRQVDFSIASDVLVYVGDGIGNLQSLDQRVSAFSPPGDIPPEVYEAYMNGRKGLQGLLDNARRGEEIPWSAPQKISGDFRQIVEYQAQVNRDASLMLEYLTLRYLSRHYLGFSGSVASNNEGVASRSEAELVKELDDMLGSRLNQKAQSTWSFVKQAALDVDSSMEGWRSISGRPLTPLPFYRATRKLIDQM